MLTKSFVLICLFVVLVGKWQNIEMVASIKGHGFTKLIRIGKRGPNQSKRASQNENARMEGESSEKTQSSDARSRSEAIYSARRPLRPKQQPNFSESLLGLRRILFGTGGTSHPLHCWRMDFQYLGDFVRNAL